MDRRPVDNLEERSQLAKAAAGDRDAQAWLIEQHQDAVYGLAFCLCGGDPHRAEELAQESFLRALRALSGFRGDSRFSTWMHRIVVNLHINQESTLAARARRRARPIASRPEDDQGRLVAVDPPAPQQEPGEHASLAEQARLLQRAIDLLDADRRTVVVLRDLQGLSYEEIASQLDVPIGTVRSRLFRAREDLRRQMLEWESGPVEAAE